MAFSSEFEPVNGNLFQTIALYYNAFKPVNGSYIQAICEAVGYYEPTNGSWINTFAILAYDNSEVKYPIDPETGDYYYDLDGNPIALPFELINGDYWQTILYYIGVNEQYFLDNYSLDVSFPINGSWVNTYYQFLRNEAGGYIPPVGYIITSSEPIWTGSNTYTRFPQGLFTSAFQTDGDGVGADGQITFDNQTTIDITSYVRGGSGYKVGDKLIFPSLTTPEVLGDITFEVLEVLEY